MIDSSALRTRLDDVRARIARAAGRAGRDPAAIRLVAVSKTFPVEFVRAAADLGQIDFGENKVQEALPKMDQTSDLPIRWHLVGHLQSNKAKKAGHFDVVHSVDSAALVARLEEAARAAKRTIELLVQVDLAGEATKHGAREDEVLGIFEAARPLTAVRAVGLMLLWCELGRLFSGADPSDKADRENQRMNVSPLDLRQQRFATTLRGFDKTEVTSFLLAVADDYEEALREKDRLRQELTRVEAVNSTHRDQEKSLQSTLMTAQKLADDIKANAEQEAKRIMREAEGRSDLLLEKTSARLEDIQREIDGLKLKRKSVETTIEATIQTLRNTLEYVREQEARDREDRVLLHRPRVQETPEIREVHEARKMG